MHVVFQFVPPLNYEWADDNTNMDAVRKMKLPGIAQKGRSLRNVAVYTLNKWSRGAFEKITLGDH